MGVQVPLRAPRNEGFTSKWDTVACEFAWEGLARCRRVNVFGVVALRLSAFPRLNLHIVVYFSQVKCPSTGGTRPGRGARGIKLPAGEIGIAASIAEDAATIAPFALVKRPAFVRCRFLKHDAPHGGMVEITQRGESRLGMIVHGFPRRNPTRPIARLRKGKNGPAGDRAEINPPRWFPPKRGRTGGDPTD